MKLREFRVREFRSIWDSGAIKADDQTTCLVGKNEAGKTALLTALYRTNPIIAADAVFDETYDYPKREVEDYRFEVENGDRDEAVVVECLYELEDDDVEAVTSVLGTKALKDKTFKRETYYGKSNSKFVLSADDAEKLAPGDPKVWFTSTESFAKVLSAGNRELLRVIAEQAPGSLEELAEITGRATSNLSALSRRWRPTALSAWSAAKAASSHPRSCMTWLSWSCP